MKSGELYNLKQEINEQTDLAGSHPEVAAKLEKMMADFAAQMVLTSRPVGVVENSRTILPRPNVKGEKKYAPSLSLPMKK